MKIACPWQFVNVKTDTKNMKENAPQYILIILQHDTNQREQNNGPMESALSVVTPTNFGNEVVLRGDPSGSMKTGPKENWS